MRRRGSAEITACRRSSVKRATVGSRSSLVGDIICRRGDHLSVMPMLVILPSTLSAFGLLTSVEVG